MDALYKYAMSQQYKEEYDDAKKKSQWGDIAQKASLLAIPTGAALGYFTSDEGSYDSTVGALKGAIGGAFAAAPVALAGAGIKDHYARKANTALADYQDAKDMERRDRRGY